MRSSALASEPAARAFRFAMIAAAVYMTTIISAAAQNAAPSQADRELKAEIQRRIGGLAPLTVDVQDGVVTLSGTVPNLWTKQEAISRTLKAGKIASVASNVTIPKAENDNALVREVSERIRSYDLFTVYDDVNGRVRNGVIFLSGAVTQPNKLSDILERVAKVRGVQDIDNKIEVLPASDSDDRLRVAIANAIYRDEAFINYSLADPPVHVIVNRGHVTLTGYVRADLERFKAESNARAISGILAFENKIEVIKKR
jgi:osmotically-inducible protein OsmY